MKLSLICVGVLLLGSLQSLLATAPTAASISQLQAYFAAPPASAGNEVWWHWINGNITKGGITADLEAMKKVGIRGAYIFDIGLVDSYNQGNSIAVPAGPINYNSPEWREMMVHAAKEADRLGLKLGMHNSCGWSSSGGPWVQQDDGLKMVVYSETKVEGPSEFSGVLPTTDIRHDLAVFAYPTPEAERGATGTGSGNGKKPERLDQDLCGLGGPTGGYGFLPTNAPVISRADMVDLTSRMAEDGTLAWDVPEGQWTILRIGYKPTGASNRAATDSGQGLEVDKLSSECVDRFLAGGLDPLIRDLGPLAGKSFTSVLIDSYEPWYTNWTTKMPEEFQARRGYDLRPYLPTLAGMVVQDVETTERFLFDFRRTVAELFAENYSARMVDRLGQHGLKLAIEPYGIGNFNCFTYGKPASLIMGEFWAFEEHAVGSNDPHWSTKIASSIVHTYGNSQVVGAESLTSTPDDVWLGHPYAFKSYSDRAFGLGINRLILACYAHDPWASGVLPGMTMGPFGSFFGRGQTWWDLSPEWLRYLSRCQYLLQSGRFFGDVCVFVGEHDPVPGDYRRSTFDSMLPQTPNGYDFDYCGPDLLMEAKVRDSQVVLPSGMSYRVLAMPLTDRMTPALARKIQSLVRDGATVVGPKPEKSPCLMDMGAGDAEVVRIASEVWADCDGKAATEHSYGKGRVAYGRPLGDVLAEVKLAPDFKCEDASVTALHRRLADADIYFVHGFKTVPGIRNCAFRIRGRKPELWHPDTGVIEDAPMWRNVEDGVEVPLDLDPAGSVFVVFRQTSTGIDPVVKVQAEDVAAPSTPDPLVPRWKLRVRGGKVEMVAWQAGRYRVETAAGRQAVVSARKVPAPVELAGPWDVHFPAGWGAPLTTTFDKLISWTEHSEFGIKYFSGTGTYVKHFQVGSDLIGAGRRIVLDLGHVRELAKVKLNGKVMGILWKPPFRLDITDAVKRGDNVMEVSVTNLWANRTLGDEQFPDDVGWTGRDGYDGGTLKAWPEWFVKGEPRPEPRRRTFTTWNHVSKDSKLVQSGLLGPVRLRPVQVVPVKLPRRQR